MKFNTSTAGMLFLAVMCLLTLCGAMMMASYDFLHKPLPTWVKYIK